MMEPEEEKLCLIEWRLKGLMEKGKTTNFENIFHAPVVDPLINNIHNFRLLNSVYAVYKQPLTWAQL